MSRDETYGHTIRRQMYLFGLFFFPTAKTHRGHKSVSRSQNFLKKYSHSQGYLAPNTVLSSLTRYKSAPSLLSLLDQDGGN